MYNVMYFVIKYTQELQLSNKCTINVHRLYVYISTSCSSAAASAVLEFVLLGIFHHYSAACDVNSSIFCHLFTSCHIFAVEHKQRIGTFIFCTHVRNTL